MTDIFSQILNMSLTGSLVICVVVLARSCMRRLPKSFSYALWSVVLFRLLCPVSLSAPGSLLELLKPRVHETSDTISVVSYLPLPEELPEFQYVSAEPAVMESSDDVNGKSIILMDVCSTVWVSGAIVLMLYGGVQFWKLRRRLVGAIHFRENIYLADHIDTAFVMGVLFPRIYMPSGIPGRERTFILAHERCHIRRGDHITKLLAYLALCIHWFNPLVWLAFILAGKDMEMSCDEAVIRRFGSGIRAEYSASLLRLAANRKPVPGMPLAFGEGDTKGRILNMAKWKKPKLWMSVLCVVLCLLILAACGVNPEQVKMEAPAEAYADTSEPVYLETIPQSIGNQTNILLVVLPEEEEAAKLGDSMLLLKLDEFHNTVTIQSIPGDKMVDLPDYESHVTGTEPVRVCYALGYVWGGRTGAMEMLNRCVQESFGIHVDYNAEMRWSQVRDLIDRINGISIPVKEEELADLKQMDNVILRNAQPGMVAMDSNAAVAYAYPESSENDPAVAERSRLRQRKLLASILSVIRVNPTLIAHYVPELYLSEDLNGIPAAWPDAMGYLDGLTAIYLEGGEFQEQPSAPDVMGLDVVTDTELVQYGDLNLLLPQGYTSYAMGNEVILNSNGTDVGGIKCYYAPDIPMSYNIEYLRAMGVPEAQETEEPIAWMISSNVGGGIVAEFFHELKPETLNVEHNFYFAGDLVYDVYYDQNILSDVEASKFLKTIELNGTPIEPPKPEQADSLLLCRNVLNKIQSGAYQITVSRENQGEYILNASSETMYSISGEDWVSITHVPDDYSYHGYMCVGSKHYSNEGSAWDENGNVNWQEDPYPDEVYIPWIASFQWDPALITYIDTMMEDGKKTVMLRIDEPFRGYEDVTNCYFVNMHFTEDGSFLNADMDIVFAEGANVNYVELSEAIVTLDESVINDYIENEYNRAVNEN